MTNSQLAQFIFVFVLLGASYWWLWTWTDRDQRRISRVAAHSTFYKVAHTGSMFVPSFDAFMEEGAEVYIAAGDGLYPSRVKSKRGEVYNNGLKTWLDKKRATIHLVITHPSERARKQWQSMAAAYPNRFNVYLLDREKVAGPAAEVTKDQITKLDTFHPELLINKSETSESAGAMWIEGNHPVGSKYAYDVEFVDPAHIAHDKRFKSYRRMYEQLLDGPHVEVLNTSSAVRATVTSKRKQSQLNAAFSA